MRAVQLVEWEAGPELREVAEPAPGPGEALVKVTAAGLCHSDLHLMDWPEGTGFVETPMAVGAMSDVLLAATAMQTPLGRLGRPEEIAATIAFLAGDDASFFVGETVSPNGGLVTT